MKSVSAIVPAYNESKTIQRVVSDLLEIGFINEIVVIDDGSEDETASLVKRFQKVRLIQNSRNKGKGYSVAEGLEVSTGEIVLILDADIINYTAQDLLLLVDPLVLGKHDYTMKMTDDPKTKYTSGVRAYWRRDLEPLKSEMRQTTKYGLETFLNKRLSDMEVKFIVLHDYKHFQKFDKYPLPRALWEYLKEGVSILAQKLKQ